MPRSGMRLYIKYEHSLTVSGTPSRGTAMRHPRGALLSLVAAETPDPADNHDGSSRSALREATRGSCHTSALAVRGGAIADQVSGSGGPVRETFRSRRPQLRWAEHGTDVGHPVRPLQDVADTPAPDPGGP